MTPKVNNAVNILVVDDESIVLSLIRDALEDMGYTITTADNGEQALRIMDESPVDLLLTDIRMPHMDGNELVRQARKKYPDIGVIYMTGYADLNSAKDAIKQGAYDYILKPFELTEIRQAISKAVERLQKDSEAKSSDKKLAQLSNLNQMLLTVADHKSLSVVSLRFAMMHCNSDYSSVLYWDRKKQNFWMINIIGEQVNEHEFTDERLSEVLKKCEHDYCHELIQISSLEEHPVYKKSPDEQLADSILPPWFDKVPSVVLVPVRCAETLYGLMMISYNEDRTSSNLNLLNIAASQLALSLENLFLLEESQLAYLRLKELQDETIQLEKMATRGEMSAEIGHELNNFLGVVAGNISLLDAQLKKQQITNMDKYFKAIFENIEQIKKFTANLMDLATIATKKEVVLFDKLLSEVVDYLKPQKRFRNVHIIIEELQPNIPFEADTTHIQQLLYNLFNNAADASVECEKREIRVRTTVDRENRTFQFIISDTGVGIEAELLPKLFSQKFTTKENGHGFGLLVCKRIIDNHGGQLHVESSPGDGTTFTISFPLAVQEVSEPVMT